MISFHITSGDIAALIRSLSKTAGKPHFTSAVIAAAGSGTRMGSGQTEADDGALRNAGYSAHTARL